VAASSIGDTVALGIGGLRGTRGYGKGLDGFEGNNVVCLATSGASNVNKRGEDGFDVCGDVFMTLDSLSSCACLRDKVDEDGKDNGEPGPGEGSPFELENTGGGDGTDLDGEKFASPLSDD
jgi:hypothetical protein